MNWVDLTLLAVLVLFALRGYFRGFFREAFSLIGLVAGFVLAVRYGASAAVWAGGYWHTSPLILNGTAFVVLFFLVYFVFNLIGWLLHRAEKILFLQSLNRIGGIALGVGKGAALTAPVIFVLASASWLPHATRDKMDGAYLVVPLSRLGEEIIRIGKDKIFLKESDRAKGFPDFPSV